MKRSVNYFITSILTIPTILFVCLLCIFTSIFISNQKVDSLRISVDNLTDYISANYHAQLRGTTDMIDDANLRAFILNPDDVNLRTNAANVFNNTFNYNDNIFQSELFAPDGRVLMSSSTDGAAPVQSQGFSNVLETHKPYVSIRLYDDVPMIDLVYPILEGDTLIGIYQRLTPLVYLRDYAKTITENEENALIIGNGSALIFNRNAESADQVKYLSTLEESDNQTLHTLAGYMNDSENTNDSGTINYDYNDRSTLGVYKKIPEMNWLIMISQSKAVIFYSLNMFQLFIVIVSSVLIAIIFIITKHYFTRLADQFRDLNNTLDKFSSGDYRVRTDSKDFEMINRLGTSLNNLLDEFVRVKTYSEKTENQLNNMLATDSVTKLGNNVALYQEIDEKFEENDKQALIMFNLDGYEDIANTFGSSVSNRLLEIVAHTLVSFGGDNFFPTRLAKDTFCIYIPEYDNRFDITDLAFKLYRRLQSIQHIDDLQIELIPRMAVVYKTESLLDRSAWLGLTASKLKEVTAEKKDIVVSEEDDVESYRPLGENILNKDIEAMEGFSKSDKHK